MKTSELTGAALDWAVAKCEGFVDRLDLTPWEFLRYREDHNYEPSTDWAQGGPIIERESMGVFPLEKGWAAGFQNGSTPLIAAMRCYVASKLGDEVEVPNELKGE